jgi:hypothetical protein
MTQDQLDAVLKQLSAKADKEGWWAMPEGSLLTIHVAHDGAQLAVQRIESLRVEGAIVIARTHHKELNCFVRDDVFALASDGATGEKGRNRAGFG